METHLKGYGDPFIVCRRYKDVDWLYSILKCKYMACIVPPIPPKKMLGNLYGDDSSYVKERREGIERFLIKLIGHKRMCGSDDLKGFLCE